MSASPANLVENQNTQAVGFDQAAEPGVANAVEISNVTVAYRSYKERPTTLKETVIGAIKHRKFRYYETFNALSNVTFNIPKGQVFGIIGSNGAGKSTLLKVIAGVLPPTRGTVKVNGSVDSLIQLGAGFDAELNAIENIYLSGALHKKPRAEIKRRIPEILEFAELEDFATTPIKYYSSGMFARLGFAVAADRNPDVLLVDEVLGVGDERFRKKCEKVFESFLASGNTIVIVSHSLGNLSSMADQIGLLSRGEFTYIGDPATAIERYRAQDYKTRLTQNNS
ncbi:MAG: ABC transporter ATP-binding protein [Bdellovibrionales bacterium]|nr:ABC transporter ATP-binding protein [Bdellovibrionales bacterium]